MNGSSKSTSLTLLNKLNRNAGTADWNRLVAVYSPLLLKWCDRFGIPSSDRDDLVQDVLIVVIRKVSRFEHRGEGAFRGWLHSILVNHVRNYSRRRPAAISPQWAELIDDESGITSRINREHDLHIARIAMQNTMRTCSPQAWQAFDLLVLQQRPLLEVSQMTSMTANAVLKARARVLMRLRKEVLALSGV